MPIFHVRKIIAIGGEWAHTTVSEWTNVYMKNHLGIQRICDSLPNNNNHNNSHRLHIFGSMMLLFVAAVLLVRVLRLVPHHVTMIVE